MSKETKVIFFSIMFFLGVVLSTQFRSILKLDSAKPSYEYKLNKVKSDLEKEKRKNIFLKESINKNTAKKEEYLKSFINDKDDIILKKQWEDAKIKAGLVDIKGPGILILLSDAIEINNTQDIKDLIVHDWDLVRIVNELKKAGSQAISINDERVISISEQVCAGPTIRVNNKKYPVPFKIKAIGDPDKMYNYLDTSNIVYISRKSGKRVEITKERELVIPKFTGSLENLTSGAEVQKNEKK